MNQQKITITQQIFIAILALIFVLFVRGVVPFFAIPVSDQAIWTTGFSLSFLNESIFSIYAKNFGAPMPAPIAFGLAGAWPTAVLIKLGLSPADAYAGMVMFWITIGFFFTYKLARFFGAQRLIAILGAVLWMSMPIVKVHDGYSMLGLGIGLLPFYFWTALNLFLTPHPRFSKQFFWHSSLYVLAAVIAVFMDGYTFMMFATGASLLCAYIFISYPDLRKSLFLADIPVHLLSLALAYFLYTAYVGVTEYEASSLDMFRGWGLDLAFIAIPTKNLYWIFDALGLSKLRNPTLYFGDSSVWKTTFCLPILIAGFWGWWRIRRNIKLATGLLLLALFSFYMAMGPSLKINSIKSTVTLGGSMPAEAALMSTHNARISTTLPGFKAMRAAYRWSALGIFCFWALLMMFLAKKYPTSNTAAGIIVIILIALTLPHLETEWIQHKGNRQMFFDIDSILAAPLQQATHPQETVAFLPYQNDFLINYLAAKLKLHAYNIGGDKNLMQAYKNWPGMLEQLSPDQPDNNLANNIFLLLIKTNTDVVIIPYFDTMWAANFSKFWPCDPQSTPNSPRFKCISEKKQALSTVVNNLQRSPYLTVTDSNLFATIRLQPAFATGEKKRMLSDQVLASIHYPILIRPDAKNLSLILSNGWYKVETRAVWSGASAIIELPVPKFCQEKTCFARLRYGVYGASPQKPVTIEFLAKDPGINWSNKIAATHGPSYFNLEKSDSILLPLKGGSASRKFAIKVPQATSPLRLEGSPDNRILGISLFSVELVRQ